MKEVHEKETKLDGISGGARPGRPDSRNLSRLIGKALGGYHIHSEIGRGGMAVVFKSRDVSLDRIVAVKVLNPKSGVDADFEKRFIREARALAKVDHPNIVQVYAAGKTDGHLFMAMQYIEGETLDDRIGKKGTFGVAEALEVVRHVACGLKAVHEAGLVHRDIKPTNIMLSRSGQTRIMDFGLSLSMDQKMTAPGMYLGTPMYSSPEQCRTDDVDGRSDLYSLGVVLYEMLTGRVPHVDRSTYVLFQKIEEERPLPVRHLNPDVPKSVAHFLEKLLAKDPDDRYQTADEVIRDIGGIQRATPVRTRTLPWGRILGRAAMAVVFLCVLSMLVYAVGRPSEGARAGRKVVPVDRREEPATPQRNLEKEKNSPWNVSQATITHSGEKRL